MGRPPMPAAPPTARSTTHRTIPQARSFERGSANRMRLISRNAHLCAQALCAGPSLHDGAGDKPRAHITVQITQEASQEKEKKYPGIAKGTMSAHRYGARLLFSGNAGSHTTRTQCSPQRRTNAHAHCSAGPSKPRAPAHPTMSAAHKQPLVHQLHFHIFFPTLMRKQKVRQKNL